MSRYQRMGEYGTEDDFIDDLAERCEKSDKAVKKIRNTLRALRAQRNRALEEQLVTSEENATELVQSTLQLIKKAPGMENLSHIAENEEFKEIKESFKKTVRSLNLCMQDIQNRNVEASYDGAGDGEEIHTEDVRDEEDEIVAADDMELKMVFNTEQVDIDAQIEEENRKDAMQLAQDTVILRDMMADTNELIHEQGEQLDQVDQHVEEAATTTEKAVEELDAARNHQKATQKMKIIIISICACLVLTAAIILAIRYGAPAGSTPISPPATTTTTTSSSSPRLRRVLDDLVDQAGDLWQSLD